MPEQKIENHINDVLANDAQKLALDFVACLRAQEMQFVKGAGYWKDKRYWAIKYKDEYVCFVLVNGYGSVRHKDEPEGWIIWSDDSGKADWFAGFPLDEHTKEIAWGNVDFCGHCGGSCDNGFHKEIFGKEFDNVCNTTFRFDNPNAEAVECAKKLAELRKNDIQRETDIQAGNTKNDIYQKACTFIYRNARPLDLARWKYHFENGSKVAVLAALAAYQNEDGGFGHALEADAWNPNSAPMQTWTATEILREIDFTDAKHPIIQGILQYLASGQEFTGQFWDNAPRSNNDYPHAPWWQIDSNSSCHHTYNPTACLAGFIIRFADRNSDLYRIGCRIAKEAYDAYFGQNLLDDMHTASCYIRLWQYCEEAGVTDIIDLSALKERLREQVRHGITKNTAEWETGYVCKPSQFFNNNNSTFYADNYDIAEYECGFIIKSQLDDGSWMIPWGWNGYPEEWAISKNWWKGNGAILNLLYLKGMGRLTK
jgi:hypothetical protein